MIRKPKSKIRGFTLIETLVAISLLMVAIVAPMSLTARSLATAYYARDQITAFHLAQKQSKRSAMSAMGTYSKMPSVLRRIFFPEYPLQTENRLLSIRVMTVWRCAIRGRVLLLKLTGKSMDTKKERDGTLRGSRARYVRSSSARVSTRYAYQ